MVLRNIKFGLAALAVSVVLPMVALTKVHAAEVSVVYCSNGDGFSKQGCDLAIKKQVSINGGAFVDAPTSGEAVQAHLGDSLTWKITVTDNSSENLAPFGKVTVQDIVPNNIALGAVEASTGTFSGDTWTFGIYENLPATLTIHSTANNLGLVKNSAEFTEYDPCGDSFEPSECIDPPYADADPTNNSSDAYVNVVAVPVVTPAPATPQVAAPKTGFGVNTKNPIAITAAYTFLAGVVLAGAIVLRRRAARNN